MKMTLNSLMKIMKILLLSLACLLFFQQLFKMGKKDPFKIVLYYLILIFDSKGTVYTKFESKVFIKGLGGFEGKSLM